MANPRKRRQKKLAKLKALTVKSGQSMREAVAEAQLEHRIVDPKEVVEPAPSQEPVISDALVEPEVKKSVKAEPAPKKPALRKPVLKSASKKAKKED